MNLYPLCGQILRDMWFHKIRSLLAIFSIFWGTIIVVMLAALSNGFYQKGLADLGSLTNGTWYVWPAITTKPFAGLPPGQKVLPKSADVERIPHEITSIQIASPVMQKETTIVWLKKNFSAQIFGVDEHYSALTNFSLSSRSRTFNSLDNFSQKRVALLGNKLAKKIFQMSNPIGQTILLAGITFKVIGVETDANQAAFDWNSHNVLIPLETFQALWGDKPVSNFILLPRANYDKEVIKKQLFGFLGHLYNFDPHDEDALNIFNSSVATQFVNWFFRTVEIFLICCGALTLSVGGIGVANIMFLIIRERTGEFGLRMALGAKSRDILFQVLLETALIVGIGGICGITVAALIIRLLENIALPSWLGHPTISPFVMFITVGILSLISLAAGFFPARKAAALDPVVALSYRS